VLRPLLDIVFQTSRGIGKGEAEKESRALRAQSSGITFRGGVINETKVIISKNPEGVAEALGGRADEEAVSNCEQRANGRDRLGVRAFRKRGKK